MEKANYQAQADVSRERKEGEIGVKESSRDTRIKIAQFEQVCKICLQYYNITLGSQIGRKRKRKGNFNF